MTELVPCPACNRHVRVPATACPFCMASMPASRPLCRRPAALTRAAIFSAALASCSHDKPAPPSPAPAGSAQAGSAQGGSDDLEQMLDNDGREVQHASPPDAAIDAPVDASAVAVDAAVPDAGVVHKKKKRLPPPPPPPPPPDWRYNAKPYGAPPARRRIV